MKISVYVRLIAVASVTLAPFAAFAGNSESAQACVNAFVAQNFPAQTQNIKFAIDDSSNALTPPYSLSSSAFTMKLSAANVATGRLLATAVCTEKHGVVKLWPSYSFSLTASR